MHIIVNTSKYTSCSSFAFKQGSEVCVNKWQYRRKNSKMVEFQRKFVRDNKNRPTIYLISPEFRKFFALSDMALLTTPSSTLCYDDAYLPWKQFWPSVIPIKCAGIPTNYSETKLHLVSDLGISSHGYNPPQRCRLLMVHHGGSTGVAPPKNSLGLLPRKCWGGFPAAKLCQSEFLGSVLGCAAGYAGSWTPNSPWWYPLRSLDMAPRWVRSSALARQLVPGRASESHRWQAELMRSLLPKRRVDG